MEHKEKSNKKKCFGSFLLPNKTPNKVGVAVIRSQSAKEENLRYLTSSEAKSDITISKRPLSFDIKHKNMNGRYEKAASTINLNRRNSLSDNNLYSDMAEIADDDDNKLGEKCSSHESVLNLRQANSMLHLIPTSKARQRNFLQGKIGANSLLGATELDRICPNREITIFVGTWNMNGHSPPKELNDFVLPVGMEHVPDVLSFGTQESTSERYEWEVSLQETIGPSHLLFHSASLGTLHLSTFIRRDLIWYISIPEDASLSVRPGSAFRTKGAVATSFTLFGTSFLFVTAHLTAHQEKVKERVSDVKKIVHSMDLPKALPCKNKSKDADAGVPKLCRKCDKRFINHLCLFTLLYKFENKIFLKVLFFFFCKGNMFDDFMIFQIGHLFPDITQNFDYVFWSGDLNFRLSTPRAKVLEWLSRTSFPLPAHLPHGYMHHDQLCSVLADGAAFKGFREAKITFPPTYKYDPGTQNFDTSSKQRTPAYTDRILYKQKSTRRLSGQLDNPPLHCLVYDSVPSITTSDHKPVWGVFKAHLRPGLDTIPLAAGLFNRDVYLEGLKRRVATLNSAKDATTVCSIQ